MQFPIRSARCAAIALLGTALLLPGEKGTGAAVESAPYQAVVPAPAMVAALQNNLNTVRRWLGEKDLVSAADAMRTMQVLVQLTASQYEDASWSRRVGALKTACGQLDRAARGNDGPACDKLAGQCQAFLDDLVKNPPQGKPAVRKKFKPAGSYKTWMKLLEGSSSDARSAEKSAELTNLAYALAEEANAAAYTRSQARWIKQFGEIRTLALRMAEQSRDNQLPAAQLTLKSITHKCDACHQGKGR